MLESGTCLGPYEILAPLGAGGMGEVYRARDPRLAREVAIKVLPPRLADSAETLARFEREAQAVAALSHPNILAIFDIGRDQGITYAVTELLDGETLATRLARGALPWRTAVQIAASIADGLSAAHARGFVHRDLKPDNIFLTADGHLKILDFGLARRSNDAQPDGENSTAFLTQPGSVMGTAGYMSPEQVRGETVGPASDLFSLGCVLYEMVVGRRAFSRSTAVQTMAAILEAEPEPIGGSGRSIPGELERLVGRCLRKDPAQRMESARDLATALHTLARAVHRSRRRGHRSRQSARPISVAPLIVALLILVAGAVAGVIWLTRPEPPVDSIAVLPFVNDSGNPDVDYLSDGISESLITSLAQIRSLRVVSRNAAFRYRGRDADAQAVGRTLGVATIITGQVLQRGNSLLVSAELIDVRNNRHLWGQHFERSTNDLQAVQEQIATEISTALQLRLSSDELQRLARRYTQNPDAHQLYLRGRYYWNKKTADGFHTAIGLFEQSITLDAGFAPAYAALAAVYNNLANYNFALIPPIEAWTKAKAAADKALALDDSLASAHTSRALVAYQWEWDWATADREFKRALQLDPGSPSTYEPGPSSTNHWYAHFLMTMGRRDEAERTFRRALELDPLDLANDAHEGWHYLFTRQYAQAVDPLRRTIELDPNFALSRWYLGFAYEQQGNLEEAISEFETAVRLTGDRPSMLALLAHALAVSNREDEARAILDRLLTMSKEQYVPPYPVAVIYAGLDLQEEAFAWLERAFKERDSWMAYLALDPRLDGLRSKPRFVSLVGRMQFDKVKS